MRKNHLIGYIGPMFSGKSTRMLLHIEKSRHAGREIHAFKPKIDDRYSVDDIVTHMGWKFQATQVSHGTDISRHILEHGKDVNSCLIVVDELFMIPQASEELIFLYRRGVDIVFSSLEFSYKCEPFEEVTNILPWATYIEKCAAACSVCGEDALFTYRKSEDDSRVLVGGKELYEPRCMVHHPFI